MQHEDVFYVLESDKDWAKARIAELEQEILNLGPEFHVALNQSSETWHDNAPFDALRDRQSLLVAEMQNLKQIVYKASLKTPKRRANTVGIGSVVEVSADGKKPHSYFIAGHWSPKVGKTVKGSLVVSCASPLGQALLGKRQGSTVLLQTTKKQLKIVAVA